MISPELFVLMHLAIIVAVLAGMAVIERRDRRTWTRWHRGVRTHHLTSEEVLRRLRRAGRRKADPTVIRDLDSL